MQSCIFWVCVRFWKLYIEWGYSITPDPPKKYRLEKYPHPAVFIPPIPIFPSFQCLPFHLSRSFLPALSIFPPAQNALGPLEYIDPLTQFWHLRTLAIFLPNQVGALFSDFGCTNSQVGAELGAQVEFFRFAPSTLVQPLVLRSHCISETRGQLMSNCLN